MMHSAPMPLNTALDMVKRLHHELTKHLTPEQRRDMSRIERLIVEAQSSHKLEVARLRQKLAAGMESVPTSRKSLWA